jgi:hypothetical protein
MIRRRRMRQRRPGRKPRPGVDIAYLAFVRKLPCVVCGARGGRLVGDVFYSVEAAHTRVFGMRGMAQRSPDRSAIPLDGWCHRDAPDSYHKLTPEHRWAEYHEIDVPATVDQVNHAFDRIQKARLQRQE